MLIDAQLCVGPVFMKSGLGIRNIRKIYRRNEHESASMTMTTLCYSNGFWLDVPVLEGLLIECTSYR